MRNETKNIIQVAILALAVVAAFAWSKLNGNPQVGMVAWTLRIAAPLAALALAGVLIKNRYRREDLPDYLREVIRRPFECNGLCFGFVTENVDGRGELQVLFQNRFANPCHVRLILARCHGFVSSVKLLDYPPIHIECEGGAFGLTRIPFAVPRKYQGKRKTFSIKGFVTYPGGRGKLLRFRSGREVGVDQASGQGIVGQVMTSLVTEPAAEQRKTNFKMRYPEGVSETIPDGAVPSSELLWKPGDEVVNWNLHDSHRGDRLKQAA